MAEITIKPMSKIKGKGRKGYALIRGYTGKKPNVIDRADTLAEANGKLDALNALDAAEGMQRIERCPAATSGTFAAFLRETYFRSPQWDSMSESYRNTYPRKLRYFDPIEIASITAETIREFVASELAESGLKTQYNYSNWLRSIGKVYAVATGSTSLMDAAQEFRDSVLRDPMQARTRTNRKSRQLVRPDVRPVEDPEVLAAFMEALRETDTDTYILAALCLFAGMRKGEARAFKWGHVHSGTGAQRTGGYLHIQDNLPTNARHEDVTKGGEPRKVPLAADLRVVLHRHRMQREREAPGSTRGGLVIDPSRDFLYFFRKAGKSIGLDGESRIRPKDLRDTFASYLFSNCCALGLVSRWLGHTNPLVTAQHYATQIEWQDGNPIVPPTLQGGDVWPDVIGWTVNRARAAQAEG